MMFQQAFQNTRRFVDTVSFLKPVQIYGRLWHKSRRVTVSQSNLPELKKGSIKNWQHPPARKQSLFNENQFIFLNETYDLEEIGWDEESIAKLWRYHLHYFDDLNAKNANSRRSVHSKIIDRWIDENPPFMGTGWEPYPVSLRIVNWLKWHFAGNQLSGKAQKSLALQARFLHSRYETHLLGNHLFANAKAMLFAGLSFDSQEADKWRAKAGVALIEQLEEQILEDGGHFELSPMYHAIILEDCLDLLNLLQIFTHPLSRIETILHEKIPPMLNWLKTMSHPDGEIAFFNDAAIGITPTPNEIIDYARRLNIYADDDLHSECTHLPISGYVRMTKAGLCLLADIGKVGPEYLAGHAHADTLSFELSIGDERFIVNSGTSLYGTSEERQRQRGTSAHNTVCMNVKNSSDVWHGFRTGKRAYPIDVSLKMQNGIELRASHDGYAPLIHRRKWQVCGNELILEDTGLPHDGSSVSRLHLHPDLKVTHTSKEFICVSPKSSKLRIRVETGEPKLTSTTWHPEFGLSVPNKCIETRLIDGCCKLRMQWQKGVRR